MIQQVDGAAQKTSSLLRGPVNAIAAILIAYLFIVVLMVAGAEQRVSVRLAASKDTSLDYSSAGALLEKLDAQNAKIKDMQAQQDKITTALGDADQKTFDAKNDLDAIWNKIAPIAAKAFKSSSCSPPERNDKQTDPDQHAQDVSALEQCLVDGSIIQSAATQLSSDSILSRYEKYSDRWHRSASLGITLYNQRERIKANIAAASAPIPKADIAESSFFELNSLKHTWLIGGAILIGFPPFMLQVILAFISGLFGALLFTLVLIVYPKSEFKLTSDGKYGARTLLGGLIAVCVYVVLSGGSTVLGTPSGFEEGQANYMTFCAVGVLAGMFSDRVASWLSDRANTFFKATEKSGASVAPTPTPSVTPAPDSSEAG